MHWSWLCCYAMIASAAMLHNAAGLAILVLQCLHRCHATCWLELSQTASLCYGMRCCKVTHFLLIKQIGLTVILGQILRPKQENQVYCTGALVLSYPVLCLLYCAAQSQQVSAVLVLTSCSGCWLWYAKLLVCTCAEFGDAGLGCSKMVLAMISCRPAGLVCTMHVLSLLWCAGL